MSSEDTEVLLASLASLLEPSVPKQSDLLNALVDCHGDVEDAARLLRASRPAPQTRANSKKRKRTDSGLAGWLRPAPSPPGARRVNGRSQPEDQAGSPWQGKMKSPSKVARSQVDKEKWDEDTPLKPRSSDRSKGSKPVDLMSVLRAPSAEKTHVSRNPPLTLSNPTMVAEHAPCTLHYSILPPELACELFYTMLDAAQGWSRNKWWLFDRLVESPHRTSFFTRIEGFDVEGGDPGETWREAAQFWYNGRKSDPPSPFPEEMEEACKYVEKVVNDELNKRGRFPLEWGGRSGSDRFMWRANVAAANCYEGAKETVGFHSDQLTYLGPYATIASLSLGTTRIFRLREVIPTSEASERQAQTFNIPLPHNSLIIMHASTQERFKHCVPPQSVIDVFRPPFPRRRRASSSASLIGEIPSSNCRINITFRFYRPDFAPPTIPRCKCGVPCVLRPDMKTRLDHRDTLLNGPRNKKEDPKRQEEGQDGPDVDNRAQIRYWWNCYSGAQNEGKGCGMWKVMDVKAEGRGPFIGDLVSSREKQSIG